MKILVTGSDGYIGSVLGPFLMERGHEVVGLDTGFYREGILFDPASCLRQTISQDIRRVNAATLEGFDAVVHLAELSNDPLGQHSPEITYQINHLGTVALANMCKEVGLRRFVYTSSCSVYGSGAGEFKTEESETFPQTAYAKCKVLVERDLSAMADNAFSPTFLRNATAYGPSPHMRFDLVLNNLAGFAWTTKEIRMTSDGTPWRPLVHVRDIARAIACTLEAPQQIVHNQIFNVGSTRENYRVREIAQIVAQAFPNCNVILGNSDGDNRSYRVRFDKIHSQLPGFECQHDARSGAEELLELFRRIDMSAATFDFRTYTRLKQLHHLLRTAQIDSQFYWTGNTPTAQSGVFQNGSQSPAGTLS